MAAGSQEENGIWALFVIPAIIRVTHIIVEYELFSDRIDQLSMFKAIEIEISNAISPIRFVRAVIRPAAQALCL